MRRTHADVQKQTNTCMQHTHRRRDCGGKGWTNMGDAHQAWTSQQFRPLICYRFIMGGGARERRHTAHTLCSSSPLPLLVQQRSLGSQVARAAARYLDHTHADPLLAASAAGDWTHFHIKFQCPWLGILASIPKA